MTNRMLIIIALAAFALSFTACATSDNTATKTAPTAASPSPAAQSTADIEKALTQLERDWIEAGKNKDKAKLEGILADDWVGISWDGKTYTKAESIAAGLAPDSQLESYTLDPLKVRVVGDVGIVTGGNTEKSRFKGQETSGHYAWTDVFTKRNGRWQAIASHSSRLPAEKK
ncbi:MAG TPA: nuclear transport factor 2 family protein [Blastocatellia bacterium]|nr:nuclear transport factor 2 family protein [Blastocatellia bacterium]